jgi:hypothetical protein
LIENKKSITSSGVRVAGLKRQEIKEDAHVCDEIVISRFIPTVCFFFFFYQVIAISCLFFLVYRQ